MWTIILYDFPEKIAAKRNYLRRKLMDLGCGSPQISALISPLNLVEPTQKLIKGERLEKFAWVFRAKKVLGISNKEIALKSWPLAELESLYGKLLKVVNKVRKDRNLKYEWRKYFLAVNAQDPYLPHELLPDDWAGTQCERAFKKLRSKNLFELIFG